MAPMAALSLQHRAITQQLRRAEHRVALAPALSRSNRSAVRTGPIVAQAVAVAETPKVGMPSLPMRACPEWGQLTIYGPIRNYMRFWKPCIVHRASPAGQGVHGIRPGVGALRGAPLSAAVQGQDYRYQVWRRRDEG
jgi:hypothetical protein